MLVVTLGQAEVFIQLAPYGTDRAIAHHRQGGADVHARHVAGIGIARPVCTLVDEPHANDCGVFD